MHVVCYQYERNVTYLFVLLQKVSHAYRYEHMQQRRFVILLFWLKSSSKGKLSLFICIHACSMWHVHNFSLSLSLSFFTHNHTLHYELQHFSVWNIGYQCSIQHMLCKLVCPIGHTWSYRMIIKSMCMDSLCFVWVLSDNGAKEICAWTYA